MKYNRKYLIIWVWVVVALMLTGCQSKEERVTESELLALRNTLLLSGDKTVLDVKNTLIRFVHLVYDPKSEDDINKGIDLLQDISTSRVIADMREAAGTYKKDIGVEISDLEVRFSSGELSTDGLRRILIEFEVSQNAGGVETKDFVSLEFAFNDLGIIIEYYVLLRRL